MTIRCKVDTLLDDLWTYVWRWWVCAVPMHEESHPLSARTRVDMVGEELGAALSCQS